MSNRPDWMDFSDLPKWVIPVLVTATSIAIVPFALIAKARTERSSVPRVELIQNMDNQPKFKAQSRNTIFADGRAMRVASDWRPGEPLAVLDVDSDAADAFDDTDRAMLEELCRELGARFG